MREGFYHPHISVIIPCYNCSECLDELHVRLKKTIQNITEEYEIIFVNDGSPSSDWEVIRALCGKDNGVIGINLSRNFGQHYAITAGLDHSQGDWVVVMDGDLQDQPEEIRKLYAKTSEGYDQVIGIREERQDNFFKKLSSRAFYAIYNFLSDANLDRKIGNFGIYSRQAVDNILQMRERSRSFGLLAYWVGFKRAYVDVYHSSREQGKSSYTFRKSLNLAIDSIIAHSNKLLKITVKLGLLLSLFSLVFSFWLFIRYFIWDIKVEGWTSLMVSIYFLAGLLMSSLGIVGIYIDKIFDEGKKRPLYIINEVIDNSKSK